MRPLLAIAALLLLAGCESLSYYGQAIGGHFKLLSAARPVDSWISDPATPVELKQQIHFQPNRAKILSDSFDVLREVAQAIKDAPVEIRIEGHTDNVGKRKENIKLSQARADAVKEYLVQEGVESKQLKSVGFGPKRPIAPNATKATQWIEKTRRQAVTKPKFALLKSRSRCVAGTFCVLGGLATGHTGERCRATRRPCSEAVLAWR